MAKKVRKEQVDITDCTDYGLGVGQATVGSWNFDVRESGFVSNSEHGIPGWSTGRAWGFKVAYTTTSYGVKMAMRNGRAVFQTRENGNDSGWLEFWHSGNFNPNDKANASHTHSASEINSGTFAAARIPSLPASRINSGTFAAARIPSLAISKITNLQDELDDKADIRLKYVVGDLTPEDCSVFSVKIQAEIQGAYNLKRYGKDWANGIVIPNGYTANYVVDGGGVTESVPIGSNPIWDANFGEVGIVQAGITQQWNTPSEIVMFGEIGVVSKQGSVIVKKGTLLIGEDSKIPLSSYTRPLYAVYHYSKGSSNPNFGFYEAGEVRAIINSGKDDVIIKVGELIQNYSSKYWYIRVDVHYL